MSKIKVMARKQIVYKDRCGHERYLKEHAQFDVVVVRRGTCFNDGKGIKNVQTQEQYLGIFKHGEAFVLQDEFKTID